MPRVCASTTALAGVAHEESGAASGFLNTWHEFGAAVGVATLGAAAIATVAPPVPGFLAVAAGALLVGVLAAILVPSGKPEGGVAGFVH